MSYNLQKTIEQSKSILSLGPNWDDNGALPISEKTWNKAINFITDIQNSLDYLEVFREIMPVPVIGPCANGSIDIHWSSKNWSLLINVSENDGIDSDYYGEIKDTMSIKGTFDSSKLIDGQGNYIFAAFFIATPG